MVFSMTPWRRPVLAVRQCARLLSTAARAQQGGEAVGILTAYNRLVAGGTLRADPTQLAAVQALQLLQDGLVLQTRSRHVPQQQQQQQKQQPNGAERQGGSDQPVDGRPHVQGAYLWGPVGSGKTMLMDLFLKTLPCITQTHTTPSNPTTDTAHPSSSSSGGGGIRAQRLHFHAFMLDVHQQLHALQQALPTTVGRSRAGLRVYRRAPPPEDPVLTVARAAAASGTQLLCLDELHVTDVADAMLLGRLLQQLLAAGVWVVTTSNRPARDLYKGGLSRRYFEPFIDLVDDRLLQLRVAGGQDYRTTGRAAAAAAAQQQQQQQPDSSGTDGKAAAAAAGLWLVGPDANVQLQQQWQQLVQQASNTAKTAAAAVGGPTTIQLPFGRTLWVPKAIAPSAQQTDQKAQQQQHHQQQLLQHQHQQHAHPHQQQLAAAYFTFEQLCGNSGSRPSLAAAGALSAVDYSALLSSCRQLFVEGLPQLQPSQRDEARRFVTLIDLVYEAHSLHPGSGTLRVSSTQTAPHEIFLPLLGAAACQGVNPNLGRSGAKLDVKALMQEARARQAAAADGSQASQLVGTAVAGEDATVGSRPDQQYKAAATAGAASNQQTCGSPAQAAQQQQRQQQQQLPRQPPTLMAEEVLMYHRAASRLAELCAVCDSS